MPLCGIVMSNDIGPNFMSTSDAAALYKRSRDYVSKLARTGEVLSRRTGKLWEVELASLAAYIDAQAVAKRVRANELVKLRKIEYARAQGKPIPKAGRVKRARKKVTRQIHESTDNALSIDVVEPIVHAAADIAPMMTSQAMRVPTMLWAAIDKNKPHPVAHVMTSVYTVSPMVDFAHRALALVTAIVLVFGSYALVNPSFAAFAGASLRSNGEILARAIYTSVNVSLDIATHGSQFANAALTDPYALGDKAAQIERDIALSDAISTHESQPSPDVAVMQFHAELSRGMEVVTRTLSHTFGITGSR